MTVNGVDISRWNGTPSLAGLGFCFVRATYGDGVDGRYDEHAAAVRRAGIVLGAYHFGRNQRIGDQVTAFLDVGGHADLLVLDLERDGSHAPMSHDQAAGFITAVHARGRRIGLYHSDWAFPQLGQDFDWVARWGSEPARHWDFWQYSGTGIDRDRYAGSLTQLHALAGITTPTPTPADTTATNDGRRNVAIRYARVSATSNRMELRKGQAIYESPGGRRVTAMSRDARVPHIGLAGRVSGQAWRAVVIGTRWSYVDGKSHPTGLFVPAAAGRVVPA